MKKRLLSVLFISTLLCVGSGSSVLLVDAAANDRPAPAQTYANEDKVAYYETSKIEGLKQDELLEGLAELMNTKHRYYTNYGDCRGAMAFSDEDPNNPANVILFYSGASFSNTWGGGNLYNREHVWCKASSGNLYKSVDNSSRGAGSDIHQLRPENPSVNSSRSNNSFADVGKQGTELKYNGQGIDCYNYNGKFEPRDGVKGDVARILMYMYTHYSIDVDYNTARSGISDSKTASKTGALYITNIVSTPSNQTDDAWNLLLEWNELDPVDSFEANRNDYCASITGVRNPYIDHPEFAPMIWDKTYSGAGALIDAGNMPTPDGSYLKLDETTTDLYVNETYQIAPITNIENPTFTYTSSDLSVANVTDTGLVTAVGAGESIITVQAGNLKASILVKVDDSQVAVITYELVTDMKEVYENDVIVIANKENSVALSKTQNENNIAGVAYTTDESANLIYNDNIQELTLKPGKVLGTYALKGSNGYLTSASSSDNYLKTSSELTENSSYQITIDFNGVATIKSKGDNTHNVIKYSESENIFASYEENNNQSDVVIYKKVVSTNDDFNIKASTALSFKADYLNGAIKDIYGVKLVFNATLNQEVADNATVGYIAIEKSYIETNGYSSIADFISKNGNQLSAVTSKANGILRAVKVVEQKISFALDHSDYSTEYLVACYLLDDNGVQISSEFAVSYQKVVEYYLNNDYLFNNMSTTEKEKLIALLNKLKTDKSK